MGCYCQGGYQPNSRKKLSQVTGGLYRLRLIGRHKLRQDEQKTRMRDYQAHKSQEMNYKVKETRQAKK